MIGDTILVDPPPDVTHSLRRTNVNLRDIRAIIISHFHADHFFGMPFLMLELLYFRPANSPKVPVLVPSGGRSKIEALMRLAYEDVLRDTPEIMATLEFHEMAPHIPITLPYFRLLPYPVQHNGIEAYGLRIEFKNSTLSFTGDTGMCDELRTLVANADILITEMSNTDRETDDHLNLSQILTLVPLLRPSGLRKVIATHLKDVPSGHTDIHFASDFEVIEL